MTPSRPAAAAIGWGGSPPDDVCPPLAHLEEGVGLAIAVAGSRVVPAPLRRRRRPARASPSSSRRAPRLARPAGRSTTRRWRRRRGAALRLGRRPRPLVGHGDLQTGGGPGVPQARGEDHEGHGVLAGLQGRRQPCAARGAWVPPARAGLVWKRFLGGAPRPVGRLRGTGGRLGPQVGPAGVVTLREGGFGVWCGFLVLGFFVWFFFRLRATNQSIFKRG